MMGHIPRDSALKGFIKFYFDSAPDKRHKIRVNPITGASFPSHPKNLKDQRDKALPQLRASYWFYGQVPSSLYRPIPFNSNHAAVMAQCGPLGFLGAKFWQSLASNDFDIFHHPEFYVYACGVMALEKIPRQLNGSAEVLSTYLPSHLEGLKQSNLLWENPRRLDFYGSFDDEF